MDLTWFPSNSRPRADPNTVILAAFIVQVGTNLFPSRLLRLALGLPCFACCAYQIRMHTAGTTTDDYLALLNVFWMTLRWVDLSVLRQPESLLQIDALKKVRKPESGLQASKEPSLLQRLRWSFSLCTTYRGIGWNWQVRNVDSVPGDVSRSRFIFKQFVKFIRAYVISDFVSAYLTYIAFPDPSVPDTSELSLMHQIGVGWSFVFRSVADMTILYYLTAALTAAVHLSKPQDWPPLFGSWREAYTVRKAWGYCWHQMVRRIFETYTDVMLKALGVRRGTFPSRYAKLYSAFFISALVHFSGCLNVPWTPGTKYHAIFFLVQPLVISLEDLFIHAGRRFGLRQNGLMRLLGYLWVALAFSMTLPMMTRSFYDWTILDRGFQKKHPIIIYSIADHVLA